MTDLDSRYGPTPKARPRWFWPVLAVVGIATGIAWTVWVAWSDVDIYRVDVFAYDTSADNLASVTVEVKRTEPVEVRCQAYAQAHDKQIVGEVSFTIEGGTTDTIRQKIEIATTRKAVTAAVRACQVT